MGLFARFKEGWRRFIPLEGLDHCYPRVHHEITPLRGACKPGSGELNLRMMMLIFGTVPLRCLISSRSVFNWRPPGTGIGSSTGRDQDTTRLRSKTNLAMDTNGPRALAPRTANP